MAHGCGFGLGRISENEPIQLDESGVCREKSEQVSFAHNEADGRGLDFDGVGVRHVDPAAGSNRRLPKNLQSG
jgi:hypothetical protein